MNKEQVVEELTARMNGIREQIKNEYGQVAANDLEVKWRVAVERLEQLQSDQIEVSQELKAELDEIITQAHVSF